ncbi:MAG: polysaccharide pyruvyl transferase family protein [Bryobacteraceae bacterium]
MTAPIAKAIQIFNGLGAGNIGDELMMHGMWRELPADFPLHIFLHENSRLQRQPYPERFQYRTLALPPSGFELDAVDDAPGLLAGTTSVTDSEGWGWPLAFLAPRIQYFRNRGLPVDAVGVGVDFLVTPEGRRLFTDHFSTIRSWTVRNTSSREALIEAGIEPVRIEVGADWAWLYEPPQDYAAWAAAYLTSLGLRPHEPLLIVNLFWQGEGFSLPIWREIACVLDHLQRQEGLQMAFFCNECRHPGFDRTAVEAIQAHMRGPSTLIPNLYFAPGEAVAILRHAAATLGQRYHFCVESVLAETIPVNLGRSPKIAGLCEELGIAPCGSLESIDQDELYAAITGAIHERAPRIALLQEKRRELAARARHNLDFFRLWYGYPDA